MDSQIKAKIAHNYAVATALELVVVFTERPDFLGGPLETDEAMAELVRQGGYGVTVAELEAEFNRVRRS
jgi:hypothetical protein